MTKDLFARFVHFPSMSTTVVNIMWVTTKLLPTRTREIASRSSLLKFPAIY